MFHVKNILSVLAGLVVALIIIYTFELFGQLFFPPPTEIDIKSSEAMRELMKNASIGSLIVVLIAYALGSFAGGVAASIIAVNNKSTFAMIVGGLLMVASIINMFMLYHPVWFMILSLLIYIPFAYLGNRFVAKNTITPAQ